MDVQAGDRSALPFPSVGGERSHRNRFSVATLVVIFLAIIATCMLVGMAWFIYHQESTEERAKLQRSLVTDADQLNAGLSLPMWNFDYSQVGKILDSAMQDRNLYGVIVKQADPTNAHDYMTYARVRDAQWRAVPTEFEIAQAGLWSEERTIKAMGEPIGRVQVLLTTKFLDQELRRRMIDAAWLTLVFDLMLIASLYFLLWKVVLNPLRTIERYATAVRAGGEVPAGARTGEFHGELESLRVSIGEMVSLLQSRMKALQEKETTLTAVLDSVPQDVYWKDASGRFLGCNRVFARTAGLENPEIVVGKHEREIAFHDEDRTVHHMDDQEVVRTGTAKIHAIESYQTQDGHTHWIDITKVPILDGEGKAYAVLGVFEDITERKRAEEERERLQEQLNQSQKLESIGRLAGGVAHDNNNMLTAILMHAELLRELLGPGNPALRHIKAMEGAAARSTGLIRQLLAFSRKQVIEPKIIDLNELLVGFRDSLAPLIGEDIDFIFKPARDLWKLKLDPTQVDQIVMNLVVNARDAMPNGGTLSIETSNVRIDLHYCLENPWAVPGDYVRLSVSDTGVGMSADMQKKIFDPFFTTKEVGKGTGLGLSTVFGIIKQNDGFINVYSEPGLGATFKIYLMRFLGEEATQPESEVLDDLRPGMGRILVVEDEEILRQVIPHILSRLGYTFIMAETPEEALQICRRPEVEIDVLLTDVVMPGMSGKELWELFRLERPDTKVIYMSGYTAEVISRQGVLDSGVHFIQKPFSTAELGKKLQSVIGTTAQNPG
jgi:PAS domain S-box-containing protein